jgi:ubiquinone/menaquinone biosynthesis C-methylase UbiE
MLEKQRTQKVWGASPAGQRYAKDLRPGTQEFFESSRLRRNAYEMRTVLEAIPLGSFGGKRVLEVGCGAGYDALQFHAVGAEYTGIDLTFDNAVRTRAHLFPYGYRANVAQGDAEWLSFPDQSFDCVFSNGVLHHTPDIYRSLGEAYRVLRPGGRLWLIVYNRHSLFYFLTLYLFHHLLMGGHRDCSFNERLARIEYTESGELPLVNVYTRGQCRKMLGRVGFSVETIRVRKLNREDLPGCFGTGHVWKLVPQAVLDRIGCLLGWYIIAQAARKN